MFQEIGNIFGKVLSLNICQYIQALEEKFNNSEKCEMMENSQLENEKVDDDCEKVNLDKEV